MCFSKLFHNQPRMRLSLIFRLQQMLRHLPFYTSLYIHILLCVFYLRSHIVCTMYILYSVSMYMPYSIWHIRCILYFIFSVIKHRREIFYHICTHNFHKDKKSSKLQIIQRSDKSGRVCRTIPL